MTIWANPQFYTRAFPVLVLLCATMGVLTYAYGVPSAALNCFLAVGFGVRLNNYLELSRVREAEEQAVQGWERLRGPVQASI
ncbi:hypothetical protein KCG44_13735 [Pacificimonas sp. WHA3]|uniref:Uncharacterized protein n=1 Tax=Pacificimonas pallii TaxID=2827236 RepID=A0ABS6SHF0_9SPHN|nr:hypothetical protein [Pacificimonas pallii]MBV7257842.1 hypothetical protein [Pacificimonas pallii]